MTVIVGVSFDEPDKPLQEDVSIPPPLGLDQAPNLTPLPTCRPLKHDCAKKKRSSSVSSSCPSRTKAVDTHTPNTIALAPHPLKHMRK
jgi:hypothetical protein